MKKNYIKLILAVELLGLIVQGLSIYDSLNAHPTEIDRPSAESGSEDVKLSAQGENNRTDIKIAVIPQKPDEEEKEALLDEAVKEIEADFLGKNTSYDAVWRRVSVNQEYSDGLVEAQWDFIPRGIVDAQGNIDSSGFEVSETVTATCTLSVDGKTKIYSFPFVAVKPDVNTPEGFAAAVEGLIKESNEENDSGKMKLPEEIYGQKLKWEKPVDHTGLWLCLLGVFAAVAIKLGSGMDEKKEAEKRREEYGRQYPDIVDNLILYVGAGISTRGSFEKMEAQYLRWKAAHPGREKSAYENLIIMNRAIRDGCLEYDAYEKFGRSCLHPSYRKLAVLLKQNIKHGNDKLLYQLSHEEQLVKDMRAREIKSAGELISTKLLLPMGGLLGMILIVLIVPALQTMSL